MASGDIIKNLFNTPLDETTEAREVFKLFEGEIKEKKAASGIMSLFTSEGKKTGDLLLEHNNPDEFLNWLRRLGGGELADFKEIRDGDLRYYNRQAESALKSSMTKKELRGEFLEEWKEFKGRVQDMQRTLDLGDQVNLKHVKDQLKGISKFSRDSQKAVQGLEKISVANLEGVQNHLSDFFEAGKITETSKGI